MNWHWEKHLKIYETQVIKELEKYGEIFKEEKEEGNYYTVFDKGITITISKDEKHIMGGVKGGYLIIVEVPNYSLKPLFEYISQTVGKLGEA